jgi:hypothetical protein
MRMVIYLLADSHIVLNKRKNYLSQLLNVHNVCDVRQIEIMQVNLAPIILRLRLLLRI